MTNDSGESEEGNFKCSRTTATVNRIEPLILYLAGIEKPLENYSLQILKDNDPSLFHFSNF